MLWIPSRRRRNPRLIFGLMMALYSACFLEIQKAALMAKYQGSIPSQLSEFKAAQSPLSDAHPQLDDAHPRCAINLYGLPRAFTSLVLPSLIKNVISHNPSCDYFMHFYIKDKEGASRSGNGGTLDSPQTIMQAFQQAVHSINPHARVRFANDTDVTFETKRQTAIAQVTNALVRGGHEIQVLRGPLYYYNPPSDHNETNPHLQQQQQQQPKVPNEVWNVLKMWHSQEAVWDLMEQHIIHQTQDVLGRSYENGNSTSHQQDCQKNDTATAAQSKNYYDYVGMLRADVFYATYIDILEFADTSKKVVIPGFGRFQVSDRMVLGPYSAVKVWATQRFDSMKQAALHLHENGQRSKLMHSETFVETVILPKIEKQGYEIVEHESICFFRARADETLWVTDCYYHALESVWKSLADLQLHKSNFRNLRTSYLPPVRQLVEDILQRPCGNFFRFRTNSSMGIELLCPSNTSTISSSYNSIKKAEEKVLPKDLRVASS